MAAAHVEHTYHLVMEKEWESTRCTLSFPVQELWWCLTAADLSLHAPVFAGCHQNSCWLLIKKSLILQSHEGCKKDEWSLTDSSAFTTLPGLRQISILQRRQIGPYITTFSFSTFEIIPLNRFNETVFWVSIPKRFTALYWNLNEFIYCLLVWNCTDAWAQKYGSTCNRTQNLQLSNG